MKAAYASFNPAQYLDRDTVIAEYLTAAAEDPNPNVFLAALGDVAKARGIALIARESGMGREMFSTTNIKRNPAPKRQRTNA